MPVNALGWSWILITAGLPAVAAVDTVVQLEPGGETAGASLRMTDRLHGWSMTRSGELLGTQDGGRTWKKVADVEVQPSWGVTAQGDAWDLEPAASDLLRVSRDGQVRRSSLPCSDPCQPAAADFEPSSDKGLLFGLLPLGDDGPDLYRSRIVVYRTRDGGRTWTAASAPGMEIYRGEIGAYISGDGDALVVSGCDLFISTDLANSWRKVSLDALRGVLCTGDDNPFSIRFVGGDRGWMRTDDGWILRTGDGGALGWLARWGGKPDSQSMTG
jgi:photosystem II stability/assembly factor-like uncharacterized protein